MSRLIKNITATALLIIMLVQAAACKASATDPVLSTGDTSSASSDVADTRNTGDTSEWSEETSGTRHMECFTIEFSHFDEASGDDDARIKFVIELCEPMTSEKFMELLSSESDKVVGLSQQVSDHKGFALLGYQTVGLDYETKDITAKAGDVILTKDHHILIAYGEGKVNGVKIASLNSFSDELRRYAVTFNEMNVWITVTTYGY